jgi:hypothetical protein
MKKLLIAILLLGSLLFMLTGCFPAPGASGDQIIDDGTIATNGIAIVSDSASGKIGTSFSGDATLKVSGDTDDYFTFSTVSNVPTITATGATGLAFGSDLITDRWITSSTNTLIGVGVAGAGTLSHVAGNTGWNNTVFGYKSGYALTSGYNNVFVGNESGVANLDGYANVFIGSLTGTLNTSGYGNTYIGRQSGQANLIGNYQTFIGCDAGYNSTADGNTFLGANAGLNSSSGVSSTIIGYNAGYNSNSDYSVILGYYAGRYNTATGSVFIGKNAGNANVGGTDNIFIGSSAGLLNSDGINNTYLGSSAGRQNIHGNNSVFVGAAAGYNSTVGYNVCLGSYSGTALTTGTLNTLFGYKTGYLLTTQSSNVMLGNLAGEYETGGSTLFIDSLDRSTEALGRTNSLIYGTFNATMTSQTLALNAGTITHGQNVNIKTVSVTKHHDSDLFNAAATTDEAIIWAQPAGSVVLGVKIQLTEQFVAAGLTTMTVTLGTGAAGDPDGYTVAGTMNLRTDAALTKYSTRGALWDTSAEGAFWYQAAASDWTAQALSGVANLNTLSAGEVIFTFTYLDIN